MKTLDVTFDLETTALTPNAAVMSIGAVAWNRDAFRESLTHLPEIKINPFSLPQYTEDKQHEPIHECVPYEAIVDLNEQFVNNFDFDKSTAKWWSGQSSSAKNKVIGSLDLRKQPYESFQNFMTWLQDLLHFTHAEVCNLWCQGTDFDIPIFKNFVRKFDSDNEFPFHRTRIRDARTYVLEAAAMISPFLNEESFGGEIQGNVDFRVEPSAIYDYMPEIPNKILNGIHDFGFQIPHSALYDAVRTSWSVFVMMSLLQIPFLIGKADFSIFPFPLKRNPNNH